MKNSNYYSQRIEEIREQIIISVREIMKKLGGKVCLCYYHKENCDHITYTFFEVDGDGYGRELFLDTVMIDENGNVNALLYDSDKVYWPIWELEDFNAVDANHLLEELEQVFDYTKENGEEVVKEYEED